MQKCQIDSILSASTTDRSYFLIRTYQIPVIGGLKKNYFWSWKSLEKVWNFKVLNLWEPWHGIQKPIDQHWYSSKIFGFVPYFSALKFIWLTTCKTYVFTNIASCKKLNISVWPIYIDLNSKIYTAIGTDWVVHSATTEETTRYW